MRIPAIIATVLAMASIGPAAELSRDQGLIVACYKLDLDGVVAALRDGAKIDGRYGKGDPTFFEDPWDAGTAPIGSKEWTPLIALANASNYPNPSRKVQNTEKDLAWAREQKAKIPSDQLEQRQRTIQTIALILLSHAANIDLDDGFGATALNDAIGTRKLELAKLLLRFNAKVNTKTGVYIDGPGGQTPLHRAWWSPELRKILLEKGADPNAKDSDGHTPDDVVRLALPR